MGFVWRRGDVGRKRYPRVRRNIGELEVGIGPQKLSERVSRRKGKVCSKFCVSFVS